MTLLVNNIATDEPAYFNELVHGASVFTTLRTQNMKPLWWPQHRARLLRHAQFFNLHLPSHKKLEQSIGTLIESAQVDIKIRLMLTRNNFFASSQPYVPPSKEVYDGVSICLSKFRVHSQLAPYKTGNYLPYLLAFQQAQEDGAFEALMCNDAGYIVDGSRSSPLFYSHKSLLIPQGGLDSIARQQVIMVAKKIGLSVVEKKILHKEMSGQILLASSTIGLVPVGTSTDKTVNKLVAYFCPHKSETLDI